MIPSHLVLLLAQLSAMAQAGTQFASHVSVNTPARSFTHGVGDPLPFGTTAFSIRKPPTLTPPHHISRGYPRVRPSVPFSVEETPRRMPTAAVWLNNMDMNIPLLPASPYKVNSPDPESLWPEGLFLPPFNSRFNSRRSDNNLDPSDPYLLTGSEAVAAVARAKDHGLYYFHDVPHIDSLLANQQLRIENNLKPHVLGSIRHTWPYYRI